MVDLLPSETIALPTDKVRHLFDMFVQSLNFGSGLLDDEDVEFLREVAGLIDVDPWVATPEDWRHKYPHPFEGPKLPEPTPGWRILVGKRCAFCLHDRDMPCHAESGT